MLSRALPVLAVLLVLGGCYTYTPVELDSIPIGSGVQAHLSAEGAVRLRERTGVGDGAFTDRRVGGTLLERDAERILLNVPWVNTQSVYQPQALTQRIDLSRNDIIELRHRRLDRTRTGILVASAALAAAVLLLDTFTGETGGKTTLPPVGGPSEVLLPGLYGAR